MKTAKEKLKSGFKKLKEKAKNVGGKIKKKLKSAKESLKKKVKKLKNKIAPKKCPEGVSPKDLQPDDPNYGCKRYCPSGVDPSTIEDAEDPNFGCSLPLSKKLSKGLKKLKNKIAPKSCPDGVSPQDLQPDDPNYGCKRYCPADVDPTTIDDPEDPNYGCSESLSSKIGKYAQVGLETAMNAPEYIAQAQQLKQSFDAVVGGGQQDGEK